MQTARVTGASRGIGRAIAARLLADGWVVINLDSAPPEAEPDDVANAVSFFLDKRAGFVTGQVLYVCGGITLARGGS